NINMKFNHIDNMKTWILAEWIPVVLMITVFMTVSCAPGQDEVKLRVMCYNIAAGHGDIDGIVEVIRRHDPDILALQEVDVHWGERSGWIDQAEYLAESLGMHAYFGEIYRFEPLDGGPDEPRRYGLAYLSKEPFVHRKNHMLSRLSTQTGEPELTVLTGFPEVAIEWQGRRIHFFNTHLDFRPDPAVRTLQVAGMMAIIPEIDGPHFLIGDLNARPDAPELEPLFSILQDTWTGQEEPGYTFPANAPDRRIDYILHSEHFQVREVIVYTTEASDHLPIVADFVFNE
ncbi:MAG: endonuclease/exonuclease/phosphatase family protein, partial [Rhodothermaceae bacterium]|nr:endonuclease/exonuclease/phosphatase family protein [Rhodothermaceae bacterium]